MKISANLTRHLLAGKNIGTLSSKYASYVNRKPRLRDVATWSHLANAFNSKPSTWEDFQVTFSRSNVGLFGRQELVNPEGFYLMRENAVIKTDQLINEATNGGKCNRKMVEIFDDLSDTLCQVADLAEFVRIGHPNKRYAQFAEDACLDINSLVEKLNTNRELFEALQQVVKNGDKISTDDIDKHVAELFLFDFEQCGIHLDETRRNTVVSLNEYILRLGSFFVNGSMQPRSVPRSDIPSHLSHQILGGGDTITLSGLVSDSHDESLRELAYRVFLYPDKHQESILDQLLHCRNDLAKLCGFETYAHRAVKGSLAGNPEAVKDFLNHLSEQLKPRAKKNYDQMLAMKKQTNSNAKELYPWDVPYYTALAKQQAFNIRSTDYCPYFSLGACMEGLNFIFQSLYDVTLEVEPLKHSEVWHKDVIKLRVQDESGVLGYIYCDFYERPDKPAQECHFTIRGGRQIDNGYQTPIVTILLNLPSPKTNCPSLLTPPMVDNLFHEMGHAMHSMLARTKYQHVTGTRCSTDLAEVPSVLMEYFASDYRVVSRFARHFKTGEPIPEHLLNNLGSSKQFFSPSETQLQVFYAALDQSFHGKYNFGQNNTEVLANVQNNFYGVPYVDNTAWHLRFSHLVGYGAKYYSYLVSRSVASWIWHKYFAQDPFCKQAGLRYRQKILQHGGSKPPKYLVEDFLDQEVTPDSLAKALLLDIDRIK